MAAPLTVPREVVRLVDDRLPPGAVLDLPAGLSPLAFQPRAHRVLLAAFHRRPTATCFTSFPSPLADDVDRLALRLPDPRAVDALRALGFAGVLVHEEELSRGHGAAIEKRFASAAGGDPRLVLLGGAASHRLYAFEGTTSSRSELGLLAAADPSSLVETVVPGGVRTLSIRFRNVGPGTFVHPDPIRPSDGVARWYDASGTLAAESPVRVLLPLALADGDVLDRTLDLAVPAAIGTYALRVSLASRPDVVVAAARVELAPSAAPTP
jgi:hypothetical protein